LGIGGKSHAQQVGGTMIAFEEILEKHSPDWVVVVGDVNATLACSITAKKMNIKVCHIEAGLRSGDRAMPEEINRLVTDRLSDLLLTPDNISTQNLIDEGVESSRVQFVGNIMIDTLDLNIEKAKKIDLSEIISKNHIGKSSSKNNQDLERFGVITMHRPSNVDDEIILSDFVNFFINNNSFDFPLIWTVHPRTQNKLKQFGLWESVIMSKNLIVLAPLRYHEMLKLNINSKIVFTDSGGIQEECTVLKTPCITLRWNTERPVTLLENKGVSVLVGTDICEIKNNLKKVVNDSVYAKRPQYWDGQTAPRCLQAILDYK